MRLLGLGLFLVTGCQSGTMAAAHMFSQSETCPSEQVMAVEQEPPSLREAILEESPPPRDVASDPDRLKMWVESHEERIGRTEGTKMREFSVYGCTSSAVIVCADGILGPTSCRMRQRDNSWR